MKKKDYYKTPWFFNGQQLPEEPSQFEGYFGFIYELTNLSNGKKYIGKKDFLTGVRVKKSKIGLGFSDWLYYTGSNDRLNGDVKADISLLRREILILCETKKELDYREVQVLFANDVIMKPGEFYNDNIAGRWYRSAYLKTEPLSEDDGSQVFKISASSLLES